ncbi:MarR family winged helix-turn-helix transcriptional regulator [Deinococcus sedimenti]|uniref:MarR family transcriptional regulator n=1 Tax=Deinococcus sedimenti TaxID=1867090 RepID=A0ABQ2S608_9DEIO|nr:MarR family transcriptional regulator [Deinococcus sedimenti]GGR91710.1 MarR family transcriptional regulator [Deinococcus sedimenti]
MRDRFLTQLQTDWQAVRPDLNVEAMVQVLTLTRLGHHLQERLDSLLAEHSLNAAGWDLLLALYRSAPPEGLQPGQLIQVCAVRGPAISNRVTRLEERGLIQRTYSPEDRRTVRVHLTDLGRSTVEDLLPSFLLVEGQLLSPLDAEELSELTRLAGRLLSSLEAFDTMHEFTK